MKRAIHTLSALAFAIFPAGAAFAGPQFVDATGFAVSGYDVVAYRDLDQSAPGAEQPAAVPGRAHITANKNGVPFDPEKPFVTSGIRLGSPAGTTRGFGEAEFRQIADWIVEVVDGLAANGEDGNGAVEAKVKAEVTALCARYPLYPAL